MPRNAKRLYPRWLPTLLFAVLITLGAAATVRSANHNTTARTPHTRACDQQHPGECTRAIAYWRRTAHEALRAARWQRHARITATKRSTDYGVMHAIRIASALYGVPLGEMLRVGACESHLTATSQNRTSTAAGVFQFLDSTWARAGVPGFSVLDPYANAIAAARLVHNDGSWREWACKPGGRS